MATINKQIVTTKVATKLECSRIAIEKTHQGFAANVTFTLMDASNKIVNAFTLSYKGANFNTFWNNFNSYEFLFEELKTKYPAEFSDLTLDNTIEQEILNK